MSGGKHIVKTIYMGGYTNPTNQKEKRKKKDGEKKKSSGSAGTQHRGHCTEGKALWCVCASMETLYPGRYSFLGALQVRSHPLLESDTGYVSHIHCVYSAFSFCQDGVAEPKKKGII